VQAQFYLLAELISRYFVDSLPFVRGVRGAKKKWPAWWGGRLSGGIRYIDNIYNIYRILKDKYYRHLIRIY